VARGFKRKGARFVARLDDDERGVIVGLLEQTHELLAPVPREPTGDPFEDLVSRLGLPRPNDLADDAFHAPRDPALERLLPSAHREDPALATDRLAVCDHREVLLLAARTRSAGDAHSGRGANDRSGLRPREIVALLTSSWAT
jgi:Domain of unknown function (DUF2017)